jgi:hypothetical protein
VQARLQEAEAHRQVKRGDNQSAFLPLLKLMVFILTGVILAAWLLTSCTPLQDTKAGVEASTYHGDVTMADQILFQDMRNWHERKEKAVVSEGAAAGWTWGDRIRFQDRTDDQQP